MQLFALSALEPGNEVPIRLARRHPHLRRVNVTGIVDQLEDEA